MSKSILNQFIDIEENKRIGIVELKHLLGQHDQSTHGRNNTSHDSRNPLKKIPPTIAYHGTTEEVLANILKKGIVPGGGKSKEDRNYPSYFYSEERAKAVFLVKNEREAKYWAEEVTSKKDIAVIFKVRIPKEIKRTKDEAGEGSSFYINSKIPPSWIESYDIYKRRNRADNNKLDFVSHHNIKKKKDIDTDVHYIPIIIKTKRERLI